jgi:hypothetical protein
MNFKQFWKDAKSRAKAMSGVDAVKKGFFGGTGIGKSLEKLAKADEAKRSAAAKDVIKALDAYSKSLDSKKLNPQQVKNVEALAAPLLKMRKLLKDFSEEKISWNELDYAYEQDEENETDDGGKGMVVSLDPKDEVIHDAAYDIASQRKLGADASLSAKGTDKDKAFAEVRADEKLKEADFAKAGANAPIVLLAHGSTPLFASSKGNVQAVQFGGKSPQTMIDYIKKTLPKNYSGMIYLDGCFTGSGKGTLVYAEQVYKGLVKAGYLYLQIKGNLGAAATTAEGKELVTPADCDQYKKDLEERLQKMNDAKTQLLKAYEGPKNDLKIKVAAAKTKEEKVALVQEIKDLNDKMTADPEIAKLEARRKPLVEILQRKEIQIEALTGTWGPEKLPPSK